VSAAFLVKSLTYLAFLLALLLIRLTPEPKIARDAAASMLGDIGASLGYVRRHRGIGPILMLQCMVSFSLRAVIELLPGFAGAVFARGVDGLAWLTSTIGVGAILGGVWLAQRGRTEGMTAIVLLSSAAGALAVLGFVAGTAFVPALIAIGASGVAMVISGVGAQTLVQMAVEPAMRGRVLSLYGIIIRGGPALGALGIGWAADYIGLRLPTAAAALLILAVCAWVWARRRSIAEGLGDR
jgi:predicted MFS family arabinose efflux permease